MGIMLENLLISSTFGWVGRLLIKAGIADGNDIKVHEEKQSNLETKQGLVGVSNNFYERCEFIEWGTVGTAIEEMSQGRESSIKTKNGDRVLKVDIDNRVVITEIKRDNIKGYMITLTDIDRLSLIHRDGGVSIECLKGRAMMIINASSVDRHGNCVGSVIVDGNGHANKANEANKIITFINGELNILNNIDNEQIRKCKYAVEFRPAIIVDSETVVDGTMGWGKRPRTVIGQDRRGNIVFYITKRWMHSGDVLSNIAKVLNEYDVVQACNLDGGSSTVLTYNGKYIVNRPMFKRGTTLPNVWAINDKH